MSKPVNYTLHRDEDGLPSHIFYQGEYHLVPCHEELDEMFIDDCYFDTDGEVCEMDAPSSWFRLLGMV